MTKRYYSHRARPVHRWALCLLFRSGRTQYRHRRGIFGPLLQWLLGIPPRRSDYANKQYYAPNRRTASSGSTSARSRSGYARAADQPGSGAQTLAERRAAQYRQSQGQSGQVPSAAPRRASARPAPPSSGAAPHGRTFHQARPSARGIQSNLPQQMHGNQQFQPLPHPTGQAPYRMSLDTILPAAQLSAIRASGRILIQVAGDTGGVKAPEPQQIVAMAMETHFNFPDPTVRPAFFYHLGDVVYYYGEPKEYYPQFYDAYVHYPAPIFAIPGNHDGDLTDGSPPSLTAFVNNFCAATPHLTPEAGETERDAITQPNVYFTLKSPFVTMIGLYSNVPEGGRIEADQLDWFINELKAAPPDKALIVSVHHPAFSADSHHSGSQHINQTLDRGFQQSGRMADMVFGAHVHNYQQFTRVINGRHVPYIVSGAGGYWHLHYMAKQPDGSKTPVPFKMPDADLVLENYCDDRHGFMRLMVTPRLISGEYFACPRPHKSWRGQAERIRRIRIGFAQPQIDEGH